MKPSFEGHIQLSSVKLFVKQFGENGPNLIVIHGGPDWDSSYLIDYMLPLSKNIRLTFFDIRGCGESQKLQDSNEYSIQNVVKDIKELLEYFKIQKAYFLGFSFGGRVLISFLNKYSNLAEGAIFASTTAYTDFQNDLDNMPLYNERNTKEMNDALKSLFSSNKNPEKISEEMAAITLPLDISNFKNLSKAKKVINKIKFSGEWMKAWRAGVLEKNKEKLDSVEILSNSNVPLLILHGEDDLRFPVTMAKKLHSDILNSKLVILSNSGHMAHVENNKTWCYSISSFIHNNK